MWASYELIKPPVNKGNIIVIFCPFEVKNMEKCYLCGDSETVNNAKVFFTTKLLNIMKPKKSLGLFAEIKWDGEKGKIEFLQNWIYLEVNQNVLSIKNMKIQGNFKDTKNFSFLWINYEFQVFSNCETLPPETTAPNNEDKYFNFLKNKVNEKINKEKRKKRSLNKAQNFFLQLTNYIFLKLYLYSQSLMPVTKYFSIAAHLNSWLAGFKWALESITSKKKLDIKVINFLLSVSLDMILGILFLHWLNSKVSLDSSPSLFLFTAESVVNSLKNLINWLRGDPGGLKLNWAFNKVLGLFFSFHIDIWWTFIAYLKPLVKIVFHIFLKLGLLGITFQASIIADLLAIVSFHIYCIYAYAAKLYSIQISSLLSLWRLFFGKKKNPLRGKVDSCIYSPEQLFVGTLGFTILLFLLPTTLLYYVVFTCIRLLVLAIGAILMLIRYINHTLPVYSTYLWFIKSPKISIGIEILPCENFMKSSFMIVKVRPVTCSWWETVNYFTPDCVPKLSGFRISQLLNDLINGKLLYPI